MLRRARLLTAGVVLLVVAGVVAVLVLRDPPPGEQARADLRDPKNFASTTRSVDTLLAVADLATAERDRCGAGTPACDGWAAAAAYAKVGAAATLQCTAPGREKVRRQVAEFVEAVASLRADAAAAPLPRDVPSCR